MPTIGLLRRWPPIEPANGASPNVYTLPFTSATHAPRPDGVPTAVRTGMPVLTLRRTSPMSAVRLNDGTTPYVHNDPSAPRMRRPTRPRCSAAATMSRSCGRRGSSASPGQSVLTTSRWPQMLANVSLLPLVVVYVVEPYGSIERGPNFHAITLATAARLSSVTGAAGSV